MNEDTIRKIGVILAVLGLLMVVIYVVQNVSAQEISADININIDVEGNATGTAEITVMTDESTNFNSNMVCEWINRTINRTVSIIYLLPTANITVEVETVVNSTDVVAYIEVSVQEAIQNGINITIHPHRWGQKMTGTEADFWGSQKADITANRNLTMWAEKKESSVSITFNSTNSSSATATISKEALENIAKSLNCSVSDLQIEHTAGINHTEMNPDGSMTVYIEHFSNQTITFSNITSGIAGWLFTESYGGAPIWAWIFVTFLVVLVAVEAYRRR